MYRYWLLTGRGRRAERAAATRSSASSTDETNGFSRKTWAPASSAAFACSWCIAGGVPTTAMSGFVFSKSSGRLAKRGGIGPAFPASRTDSAEGSIAPTSSTSGNPRSAGRWILRATPPRPISATFIFTRLPVYHRASRCLPSHQDLRIARGEREGNPHRHEVLDSGVETHQRVDRRRRDRRRKASPRIFTQPVLRRRQSPA